MAGIASVVTSLKQEFENATKGLHDVDQDIRKLTGREPGIGSVKGPVRRNASHIDDDDGRTYNDDSKRRRFVAFSRVSGPGGDRDDEPRKPTIASSIVANPARSEKPRTQAIEEQKTKTDQRGMARNRRMFGMILGTLQRFQSEESRRKETTQKRVEIEKKVDQVAEDEKVKVVQERKELFKSRRQKQAEIRKVEQKMERVEMHQDWEKSQQFLGGFIRTKAKPFIFYMPKKLNSETERRLDDTKDKYRLIIAEKRAKVQKELSEIDDLYKREAEEEEYQTENAGQDLNLAIETKVKAEPLVEEETTKLADSLATSETLPVKQEPEDPTEKDIADGLGDIEFEPIYDE